MTTRKSRSTPKAKEKEQLKPAKPTFRLDADRWEEISAIGVIILAALTAVGAFNLSGGVLLNTWTQILRGLFGWGVYFAPLLLLGLGVWLILDSLNKTWNIGWERPIGLGVLYLGLLAVLHWISAYENPIRQPGLFQGGGVIGWIVASLLIGSFGEIGTALALIAIAGVALILLFNISLPELFRRLVYLVRIILALPQELQPHVPHKLTTENTALDNPPAKMPIEYHHVPSLAERPAHAPTIPAVSDAPAAFLSSPKPAGLESKEGRPPTAVRVIGENRVPAAPVIPREWVLPNIAEMLEESNEAEINQQEIRDRVHKIEETLAHFGVPAKVLEVNQGPAITQFGVEPGFVEQKGVDGKTHRVKVKVSRISALQHDLELALAAAPIRIEAPVPGKSIVGIEVPNSQISKVSLRGVMEAESFKTMKAHLGIALGQDVAGQPICADLTAMPHLLVAGATGSGKSVCVNAIIACLLCTAKPDQVQFVMVDPKRVELVNFNGIPHLRTPVVVEMDQAVAALQGAVREMDRRFQMFAKKGARNLDIYNHLAKEKNDFAKLPYLIVIVDELADLMMIAPDEVERAITRLAQMARATGIHLLLATQRPSVDVVTGLIKANFPSRISFAVTSQIDSRVVLDTPGAEKLLGRGDMLYMASDSSKLVRLQGCFVSDRELEKLVAHWKAQVPAPQPTDQAASVVEEEYSQPTLWKDGSAAKKSDSSADDLLAQAIAIVQASQRASVSLLQRKLRIGYSRAARLMELLEEQGYVSGDAGPTKGRAVIRRAETPTEPRPAPARRSSAAARTVKEDDYENWTEQDWEDLDKG